MTSPRRLKQAAVVASATQLEMKRRRGFTASPAPGPAERFDDPVTLDGIILAVFPPD